MGGSKQPGSVGLETSVAQVDEGTLALMQTPQPLTTGSTVRATTAPASDDDLEPPMSGGVPYAVGQASVVRIPVPGTRGLAIELRPRGWTPAGGSTSTLFFQDPTGKRHLRLDYGYNVATKTVDYHWNQKGTFPSSAFAITPRWGQRARAYNAAKYFRYAGRVLMVVGVAVDAVSIVQASKPLRRASEVVAGWAAAWAGCKVVGAGGAAAGLLASPLGSAVGGIAGCIIGGIGGYYAGSAHCRRGVRLGGGDLLHAAARSDRPVTGTAVFACRNARNARWQLGGASPHGGWTLIGWRQSPGSEDGGVPGEVAALLADAFAAVARVTFPHHSRT